MNSMACYNESTLKEYLAGWTDEPSSSRIESHLSECQACEQTLAALEGESDTLVAYVQASCSRAAASDAEPSSSPAVSDHCDLEWPGDQAHVLEAAKQLVHESGNDDGAASGQNLVARSIDSSERIGDYELIRPIGRGGMGAVFEARHTRLDKRFALKLLPATAFRSEAFAARFEREMRAAGSLSHPAIVQATDAGECPQAHYLAMELVDGLDVSKLLAAMGGPLSVRHACEVGRQVALALTYAHAKGIVHRDIKPSNVMISVDGDIKLLDFGLATTSLWDGTTAELTTVGQLMGTLDYMAPEQAESPETVDYRADLYGLGATLFRMLTGRTPLAASPTLSPITKLRLLAMHSPPSLATLCPECPQGLVQLVDSLLARHPEDRPPSAAHVAELLEPWTGDDGLATLVSEAMDVTAQEDQGAMSAAGFATVALVDGHSESTVNHSGFWTRVLAGASMLALIAAGILFTIETQKGELVIESDVPGVQVTIVQDGREDRELTVSASPEKTRLFAGSYEVRLSEGSDKVEVVDGAFTLSRGETKIARVRLRKPNRPGAISEASGRLPASSSPLKPGDRLEVQCLNDEYLNCTAVVQADGTAKFPLVGTLDASGMTVAEFEKRLEDSAMQIIKNPAISLRRGFSGLNAMADFVPPASTATLQPGDALLVHSLVDDTVQARLVVQADLMIEPLQLAPVSVRGLTVDGAEAMLNDLYSTQFKDPGIEVFRDFSTPNPSWQKRRDRDDTAAISPQKNWDQALYDGKPLGEWIDLLARERSYEAMMKAMNAIQATYDPRAAELVREAALVSLKNSSGDEWMLAALLRRTTETNEEYYELLLGEFERPNCSIEQKKRMLQWMLFTNNDETPEQMSPVLGWIESEVLSGEQPELVQVVFDTFFTALNEHATFGFSEENGQADHPVFEMLRSSDVVSDQTWFPAAGPAGSGITRVDRLAAMKAPWASEVARRAVAMIHDRDLSKNKAEQIVEAADVLVELRKRFESGQLGLSSQELEGVVESFLKAFSGHRAQLAGVDQLSYAPSRLPNEVHVLGCSVLIGIDAHVSIPLLVAISLAEQAYPADEYQNWLESQARELVAASSEVAQRPKRFVVKVSELVGDDGVDRTFFVKTCIALAAIYDKADDELRDKLSKGMGLAGE